MIRNFFGSDSKTSAMNELLEVIGKGIDVLGKDTINNNVLDAWKKYAISTLELVDSAYNTSYTISFAYEDDPFNAYPIGARSYNSLTDLSLMQWQVNRFPNTSLSSGFDFSKDDKYKAALKKMLQKIIEIMKRLPKE